MTWKTEPIVTSSALIGVFSGSRMRRSGVNVGSSPGRWAAVPERLRQARPAASGRGRRRPGGRAGTANRPSAPPRVYLMSGRRVICERLAALGEDLRRRRSRDSSLARSGWRSSTSSSSGIRVLAQCTAPKPMPSRASASVTPSARLEALVDADARDEDRLVEVDGEVADDEEQGAEDGDAEQRRRPASRRAGGRLVEVGGPRRRAAGRPGLVNRSGRPPSPTTWPSSSRTAVPCSGAGPPRYRCGWCPARSSGYRSSRRGAGGDGWRLGRLGAEPDGAADEEPEAEDPGEQALGHRTERARASCRRGSRLLVDGVEEGDDVALALGGEVGVVEHRHVCGPVTMAS